MNLDEYFNSPGAPSMTEFAKAVGVKHPDQVRQWRHGYAKRRPSPKLCVVIERVTGGKVTRPELRPDDWREIWPELIPLVGGVFPNAPAKAPSKVPAKKVSKRTKGG